MGAKNAQEVKASIVGFLLLIAGIYFGYDIMTDKVVFNMTKLYFIIGCLISAIVLILKPSVFFTTLAKGRDKILKK